MEKTPRRSLADAAAVFRLTARRRGSCRGDGRPGLLRRAGDDAALPAALHGGRPPRLRLHRRVRLGHADPFPDFMKMFHVKHFTKNEVMTTV